SKQSDFGVFGNRIEEMHEDRQRPGGVLMQRTLEDGSKVECLMYQIKAPVYIERLEDFELPPTRIGFAFPQTITEAEARRQLKRDMFGDPFGGNGFFGSIPRFRPSQDRILTLALTPPEITILPLPTEGRPQSFTGAVGSFTIDTESSETTVKVGQSFPLLINLRDAADPPSLDAVERLLPPELQKQSIFDQTFQTSATPPPGVVTDGAKRFRFMIRPRSIASNQIPPVEFSFFDPKKRKYRTIKSEAIELDVEPGSAIAVNAMKSEPGNEPAKALESEETAIPLWMTPLPPGEGWLTRSDPFAWRNHVQRAALVGLPMIIWFAMTVFLQIQRWHQGHRSVRRWQRQIASASSLEEICGILAVWAKPLVLNSQVPDSQAGKRDSQRRLWDAVGVMRREGHGNLASRLESFLEDVSRIGSRVPKDLDRPKQSALQLVAERLPSPEDPTGYGSPVLRRHLTSASLMFASVGSLGMSNSTSIPALETLRETLDRFTIPAHTDAASHTDAMKVATTDGKSVLKAYRTLLEQYPSSAELHLRLASFTGTMGDPSLQSLHELAAEKLEPYHRHSTTSFDHDLNLFDGTVGDFFDKTCVMVARWIGDLFVAAIVFGLAMLIGWFVYLIFKRRRIALTSFSGILFASLLVLALIRVDLKIRAVQQWKQPAVITQTTTPRLSDGDSFQEAMSPLEPGDKADILEKRYQWSKIRVDGKEGWVRAETLRSIPEGWL
ncbi:MAG: BatD family protein, partial [Planctomycetota bacterium]